MLCKTFYISQNYLHCTIKTILKLETQKKIAFFIKNICE